MSLLTDIVGGSRIDVQEFPSSDTWDKPSWAASGLCMTTIELIGPGGGRDTDGSNNGGGGGLTVEDIPTSLLAASESVSIGAGGDADATGSDGGDTTFAGYVARGGKNGTTSSHGDGGGGSKAFGSAGMTSYGGAAGAIDIGSASTVRGVTSQTGQYHDASASDGLAGATAAGLVDGDRDAAGYPDKRASADASGGAPSRDYGGGAVGSLNGGGGWARITTRRIA